MTKSTGKGRGGRRPGAGRPRSPAKLRRVGVGLTPAQHQALSEEARARHVPVADIVREWVAKGAAVAEPPQAPTGAPGGWHISGRVDFELIPR